MSNGMMDRTGSRIMAGTLDSKKSLMGVETPIPPVMINARRPEGRPAAGFWEVKDNFFQRPGSNHLAPPCLGVRVVHPNREEEKNASVFFDRALRRGALVKFPRTDRLSGLRYEQSLSVSVSPERKQQQNGVPL
jgi:hypothetical protein